MKRIFDFFIALIGLLLLSPILLFFILTIWLQDRHSPFYIAPRVGINGKMFNMIKLRTMIVNADKSGVDSTSSDDKRITRVGHIIRKFKFDELLQLLNVLVGQMSLVGPRPQVKTDVDLYTDQEKQLLSVLPGITDFSSIVFADEGKILEGSINPDLDYNQLIRPWKSRFSLIYVEKRNFWIDIKLIFITLLNIFSREKALQKVHSIIKDIGISDELIRMVLRKEVLVPYPPPGSKDIVHSRN